MIIVIQQQFSYGLKYNRYLRRLANKPGHAVLAINTEIFTLESTSIRKSFANILSQAAKELFLFVICCLDGVVLIPTWFLTSLISIAFLFKSESIAHSKKMLLRLLAEGPFQQVPMHFIDSLHIYSTILRFAQPKTYLSLRKDNSLRRFSLHIIYFSLCYKFILALVSKFRPALYISLYSSYVQHGFPAGIFLKDSIPVWILSARSSNGIILSNIEHNVFPDVPVLPESSPRGKDILENRISGVIDKSINYMSFSAYAGSHYSLADPAIDVQTLAGFSTIIYMHELCDSHLEGKQPYPFADYYDWLEQTCEYLSSISANYAVKIHPALDTDSASAIQYRNTFSLLQVIKNNYNVIFTNATTPVLIQKGMTLGITVEGSVGPELAYLGVSCVALPTAQYSYFNMCYVANSRDEYFHLISNPGNAPFKKEFREQACTYIGSQEIASSMPYFWDEKVCTSLNKAFGSPIFGLKLNP